MPALEPISSKAHSLLARFWTPVIAMLLTVVACERGRSDETADTSIRSKSTPTTLTAMKLTSPAFTAGDMIPERYTCEGDNVSPPLAWSGMPDETSALAIICDDPDAPRGDFTHWVLYSSTLQSASSLDEDFSATDADTRDGTNDFGDTGYGGPCPPPGKPHRYSFRIYALDEALDLPKRFGKAELVSAIEGHVIAQAELAARFGR